MADGSFPGRFLWGAATSSYQIEGAVREGGRGPSIWDRFAARPGSIVDGTTGNVACAHYHRWREDIGLLKQLGVSAYRFSVAWPRVFPEGRGTTPNEAGLDFYDRLVDALLESGITPFVTLYHWDLPQPLEDEGGWPSRDIVAPFVAYADAVTGRLGDRVQHWITHNEPWIFSFLGYLEGVHAPGRRNLPDALAAAHHALLSHGEAVPVIRGNVPGAQVGITLNLVPGYPASPSAADAEALRRFDGLFNRWFLDPLHGRGYPKDVVADYGKQLDGVDPLKAVRDGDLDKIAAATDFLGVNYYTRHIARSPLVADAANAPRDIAVPPAALMSEMGWEDFPDGLHTILTRVHRDYGPAAFYVTENGAATPEQPDDEGVVRDDARIRYLAGHVDACRRAVDDGVPLRGYFVWSLLDNFEWAYGYTKRFGLHWVDYETQERRVKQSGRWYREVVRRNGLTAEVER